MSRRIRISRLVAGRPVAVGLVLVGIALGAACRDEPTAPSVGGESEPLQPGINVFLAIDDASAAVGSVVLVSARARAVDVDLTPAGYVVQLRYDPGKLLPVRSAQLQQTGLRVVNLEAGPGLMKAAGAAAAGLDGEVLFAVQMGVAAADYVDGLELDVLQFDVLERKFADMATEVLRPPLVTMR